MVRRASFADDTRATSSSFENSSSQPIRSSMSMLGVRAVSSRSSAKYVYFALPTLCIICGSTSSVVNLHTLSVIPASSRSSGLKPRITSLPVERSTSRARRMVSFGRET